MPARTIVCPDCGEAVPSGRLSCPACGALLAAVTGGAARPSKKLDQPTAGDVSSDDPSTMAPARIQTQALPAASPDDAQAAGPPADRGPAIPMEPSSIRQTEFEGGAAGSIAAGSMIAAPAAEGAYVPPGTALSPETLPGPVPTAPAAPDGPSAATAPDSIAAAFTEAPATWDLARLDQALGLAAALGSGLIAFGMFMPWSRVVIGATGTSGFFDTWGLAGPAHLLVLLWAMAVLAVSVLPNRIPVAFRSGLAGLMLGVFSLGLVWPYIVGPLGAGIGVLVVTVGALVLTATGVVSAWRERHAADDRSV